MGNLLFLQSNNVGEGRIDNFIINSSLHLYGGVAVLITMTFALVLVGLAAYKSQAISRPAKLAIVSAQLSLGVQVLLGVKLLDQGQGIFQLYIHYVGGLIPLGAFLSAGWFARGDNGKSSRILFGLVALGYVSCLMAFFIGRAYVN